MKKISNSRSILAGIAVLCAMFGAQAFARPAVTEVSLTGRITCSLCSDLAQHKGFTPWTWAMYKVSQGDDIVFFTDGKVYRLQGDRQQLSKYMEDKVTVSGQLDANTIVVTNIVKPAKEK
jgi:hypothetical protein